MIKLTNKTLSLVALLSTATMLIILQYLSTGVNGETDSISHYQLARYAFKYPAYFLDHWGKPLFTILSAPLAQLGYSGAVAFNLICGLLSAWFAYLIAKRLGYRHAWAAIIFTVFTPLYLFIMFTSLTEILFSLVLIASIYLFISKRFVWSAIAISLIPFARTEGVMFVILFIPALLLIKQYKALPFLLTGFVFFGLIGLSQYHDFFWFFTKMPYSINSASLYGSGSFWYYFLMMEEIINYPLMILGLTGLVFLLFNLVKNLKNIHDIRFVTLYFLVIPSIFGFILAQSYLWWQGLGILASNRFIACVLPLGAIITVTGFEWVMEKARINKVIYWGMGAFILSIVMYKPFTYNQLPMKTGINFAVMQNLTTWLKTTPYSNHKAYYSDPMFPFYMDMDPSDAERCYRAYSYENGDPSSIMKPGELLIWDAQFTGYEGHMPFDSLMINNNLRLMNVFTPVESFTIIGGEKYKLAVFMKAPRDTTRTGYHQFYYNTFESGLNEEQLKHVTTDYSSSGKQSVVLSPEFIYSPTAEGKLTSLPGAGDISVRASVRVLNPSLIEKGQILLVVSMDDPDHKIYKYAVAKDTDTSYKLGEWFSLSLTDVIERNLPVNGNYKVYVWYTGKEKIYVDDLKLEYMPVGYE